MKQLMLNSGSLAAEALVHLLAAVWPPDCIWHLAVSYPRAVRTHILRFVGPKTRGHRASGLF